MAPETKKSVTNETLRTPLVDIYETDEGVCFQFELPGIPKDKVNVHVDGDTLSVSTNAAAGPVSGDTVLEEFASADFAREFVLSKDLDTDRIGASYGNGVLVLTVPKAEAAQPRKVEIEIA